MSSLATSSPVSASTFAYLIRWPVFRFNWLKEIFSDSEVAGYSATGQVTRDNRRKPFQLARGAIRETPLSERLGLKTSEVLRFRQPARLPRIHFSQASLSANKNGTSRACSIRDGPSIAGGQRLST